MEQSFAKSGIYIGLGIFLIFGLRWLSNHWSLPMETVKVGGFSYEMPRPKSYVGSFDLSGREVDREVLSDEEIAAEAAKAKKLNLAKKAPVKTLKKNAANAYKPEGTTAPKLSVDVVDTSLKNKMSQTSPNSPSNVASADIPGGLPPSTNTGAGGSVDSNSDNSSKRSAAEWLSMLSTAPTATLIAQFEQAHENNAIGDADFYSVTFSLLTNQNQQQQATGTQILNGDTGVTGFTYIAQEYSKVTTTLQPTLMTALSTYAKSTKFEGLNIGLRSSSSTVVGLALTVLAQAVKNVGQVGTLGGTGSKTPTGTPTPASLQIFESALTTIAKSGSTSSSQAQTLLSDIESMSSSTAQASLIQ